ncbi:MAG TPA: hypothetical protein VKB60_03915, partial [Terriglobales bacterium]|nr:hypothetical protein [Terriglobales bacterium]
MNAGLLSLANERCGTAEERATPAKTNLVSIDGWNPEKFARQQIQRLVRQVFCVGASLSRQVVFSALERETDIQAICLRVGEALALETSADVAVVGTMPDNVGEVESYIAHAERNPRVPSNRLRKTGKRLSRNLWLVPADVTQEKRDSSSLHIFLGELRHEFEYSIVQGQAAGESSTTTEMAQIADGLVLVVSAERTRRASARQIKEMLD